jgi:hypothetical protein
MTADQIHASGDAQLLHAVSVLGSTTTEVNRLPG